MVTSVTGTAVIVAPTAGSGGKDRIDRRQEIDVTACASLDDRQARGGVRDEDRHDPVGPIATESCDFVGDVDHAWLVAGLDLDLDGLHQVIVGSLRPSVRGQ